MRTLIDYRTRYVSLETEVKEELENLKRGVAEGRVEELLLQRWSPRAFDSRSVSQADLRALFSAGQWAASAFNEQPWYFLVGSHGDAVWQGIWDCLTPGNQSWTSTVPLLYASLASTRFAHNDTENRVAFHDVGAASAQISLQATALGMHTHGMSGFDVERLRLRFGLPRNVEPVACWAAGFLGDPGALNDKQREQEMKPRQRKALGDFVFSEWRMPVL